MTKRRDDDLAAELDAHLSAHIADKLRACMTPDEARCSALLKLGGAMQTTELVRDAGSMQWLDDARLDLRHSLRSLRRASGFAMTAVALIALGIAATTAAFTMLDHVLLRPLPFPQPDRLVRIYQSLQLFDDIVAQQTASRHHQLLVLGRFVVVAFLLAAIGIYGLLSYTVQARTQEVGVRVALGARPATIARMFLAQGVELGLAGIAVGVPIAYGAGRAISALLFGLKPSDPAVYLMAIGLAAVMTVASAVVPVARAATLDPLRALRAE